MTRTRPSSLAILGLIGIVVAYVAQLVVVSSGGARYQPPILLPVVLLIVAVFVVLLAIPIWRATHQRAIGPQIDPFHATRIVMLAKSCALVGALLTGVAIGLLTYQLTRTVPEAGSVITGLVVLVGTIVLMIGGLVAEFLCTVPPDNPDDRKNGDPERIPQ